MKFDIELHESAPTIEAQVKKYDVKYIKDTIDTFERCRHDLYHLHDYSIISLEDLSKHQKQLFKRIVKHICDASNMGYFLKRNGDDYSMDVQTSKVK